ncbi:Fruit bromelain protein [Dioscorea alata]|uniref:Fruit bromelain protein n=1 Tax=Dioscorea alata TaxID=55571 RepID=A0ACB7UZP3_DIOAL|nr:Fruit bromelain protein [Dioscorea alata]
MAVAKLAERVPLLLLLIIIQTWAIALLGVLPIISASYIPPLRCCGEMRGRHMQWMQTHNKTYKDPTEHEHRCCVYQTNVNFIERFNSHAFSFNLTDNCFADLTNEEFLQTHRCLGTSLDETKKAQQNQMKKNPNCPNISDKPSVDWRDHGAITPVKDQQQCGSCWAFSAVASIEAANKIKNNATLVSLSEQELVDCDISGSSSGCSGGFMTQAFDFVQQNNGLTGDANYPYTGVQGQCNKTKVLTNPLVAIKGYMNVTSNSEDNLADAVTGQPVSVAIDAGGYLFQLYSQGVYDGPCGTTLNHGVTVVGFGTNTNDGDYWIVKNSWGAHWGEGGYIRMRRGVPQSEGLCGITLKASYPLL